VIGTAANRAWLPLRRNDDTKRSGAADDSRRRRLSTRTGTRVVKFAADATSCGSKPRARVPNITSRLALRWQRAAACQTSSASHACLRGGSRVPSPRRWSSSTFAVNLILILISVKFNLKQCARSNINSVVVQVLLSSYDNARVSRRCVDSVKLTSSRLPLAVHVIVLFVDIVVSSARCEGISL